MTGLRASMLLAVSGMLPCSGAAQGGEHAPAPLAIAWLGPVGRTALDPFLDSLSHVTTVRAHRRIAQRWDPRVHTVARPLGRLRLGFHLLRRGQITGERGPFDDARATFAKAAERDPHSPLVWYALGLADLELRRRDFPDPSVTQPHMSSYTTYYLGARRAFEESLAADPMFRPTLEAVKALAAGEGDRTQPKWLVAGLRRLDALVSDPDLTLVLGRQDRMAGDYAGARAAFEEYQDLGGDTGVARLELARTLAGLGEWDQARDAYWTGVHGGGDAGRNLYRTDLAWVATSEEIARYDSLPADSLAVWVEGFWSRRDLEALRPPGTRLREHLRRWNVAHRSFRVRRPEHLARFNPPLIPNIGLCRQRLLLVDDLEFPNPSRPRDLRSYEPLLDQRAILYMRHGDPLLRSWSGGSTAPPVAEEPLIEPEDSDLPTPPELAKWGSDSTDGGSVEIWSYWVDGAFRFYFLMSSDAFGPGPTTIMSEVPAGPFLHALLGDEANLAAEVSGVMREFARVRNDLMAREAGLKRALPASPCTVSGQKVRTWAEEGIKSAVATDGDALLFRRNLFPMVQALGMPGAAGSGQGMVLLVFAVPARNLMPPEGARSIALRFRISGVPTESTEGFWVDTTRTFRVAEPLQPTSFVTGLFEVRVPPERYEMRVAVELADSSAGNAIRLPGTITPWAPGDSLRLSGIVAGGGTDNLLWTSLGSPVSVNPLAAYQRRDTVELYYVQGGLRPGTTYRTEIVMTKVEDNDKVQSFGFEEMANAALEGKRRGLALRGVRPGTYLLRVTVSEVGSRRGAESERRITVVE